MQAMTCEVTDGGQIANAGFEPPGEYVTSVRADSRSHLIHLAVYAHCFKVYMLFCEMSIQSGCKIVGLCKCRLAEMVFWNAKLGVYYRPSPDAGPMTPRP